MFMKKTLNTTLVAVALAVAFVGNVDAKRLRTEGGSGAPQILEAARNVVTNPTEETAQALEDALDPADKSPEEAQLVVLKAKKADLEARMQFRRDEMKSLDYGWFGFGTSKETKEKYSQAKEVYNSLNKELRDVKAEIRDIEKLTGKAYSNAVDYAIKGAAIAGITIGIISADQYFLKGAGREYLATKARASKEYLKSTKMGQAVSRMSKRTGELASEAGRRAGTAVEGVKGRLGYGTPVKTETTKLRSWETTHDYQ